MRIVPQLDRHDRLIAIVQKPAGKIAAAIVFALLLFLNGEGRCIELAAIVAALSFFPQHRRPLLSGATFYWLLVHPNWIRQGLIRRVAAAEGFAQGRDLVLFAAALMCVVFCALGLLLTAVRKYPDHPAGKRPVLVMVVSFLCLLASAGTLPLHGLPRVTVWILIALAGPYLWFFAYALGDYGSRVHDPYVRQFGTFFPFWVGSTSSSTPMGKGAAYLRKVEARTPRDLAIVQLKAIKLLIWIFYLRLGLAAFQAVIYGHFRIPTLAAALDQTAAGNLPRAPAAWAAVVAHFIDALVGIPIAGNLVVACCRMAGFNILRNTYKPLYATTIAEFWNRFYFYFKELLVEFFFFPTFVRYFKKHRRLRLATATFAAATVGNVIYHFCRDTDYVFSMGFWPAVAGLQVYAFYALMLGAAISLSQLRGKRAPKVLPLYRRVMASIGVIGFYCLLEIFDYEGRNHTLRTHAAFFLRLFPLGT